MFHSMAQKPENPLKGDVRTFVGSGTPFLPVPGCKSVSAVRVGVTDLPENYTFKNPIDATLQNFQEMTVPMYVLHSSEDGVPTLLRNACSNDGIWQAGVNIYVSGEWEEADTEEGEKTSAPAKGKK